MPSMFYSFSLLFSLIRACIVVFVFPFLFLLFYFVARSLIRDCIWYLLISSWQIKHSNHMSIEAGTWAQAPSYKLYNTMYCYVFKLTHYHYNIHLLTLCECIQCKSKWNENWEKGKKSHTNSPPFTHTIWVR